jgi:hypothetical protein
MKNDDTQLKFRMRFMVILPFYPTINIKQPSFHKASDADLMMNISIVLVHEEVFYDHWQFG